MSSDDIFSSLESLSHLIIRMRNESAVTAELYEACALASICVVSEEIISKAICDAERYTKDELVRLPDVNIKRFLDIAAKM